MKAFSKVTTPLYSRLKYNRTLLLKDLKPKRFVDEPIDIDITFKGPKFMYQEIQVLKKY